jgi:hypothetical protein
LQEISLDNDIEKAGAMFDNIDNILIPVADGVKALSSFEAVQKMIGKFAARGAARGDLVASGYLIEAESPSGDVVQIYNDIGFDGVATPLQTEEEVNAMKKSLEESGKLAIQAYLGA